MQQCSQAEMCPEDHGRLSNVYDPTVIAASRSRTPFRLRADSNRLYRILNHAKGTVLDADFRVHRYDGSQRSIDAFIRTSCQVCWNSLPPTEKTRSGVLASVRCETGVINY